MFSMKKTDDVNVVEVTIPTSTYIKIAILILATIGIVWGVRKVSHALLLIGVSFFLSLALNGPVNRIARIVPGKLRGNRILGTAISYLIVVLIIGTLIAYIGPPLARQSGNFIKAAPNIVSEFKNQSGAVGKFIRHYHLQSQVTTVSKQLSSRLHNVGGAAFHTLDAIGKSVFSLLVVLVLTFMMLAEGPRWIDIFRDIIPDRYHKTTDKLARDMYRVIRGFVNGQVFLAALAACLISPALFILHLSYPVALIAVIFICALIPLVGHFIGGFIVTCVGLFHSTSAGIIILVYYIIYEQFEAYFIQPKVQANSTNMSPLLVFGSLIIGLNFGGIAGGLLAIPIAGCLRIALLEFLSSHNLLSAKQLEAKTN